VGSTVNHFGFQVGNMKDWLPKWQTAGLRMEPMTRSTQVYLLTPDDVRVEILEEPSLSTPIAGHHIHCATQPPIFRESISPSLPVTTKGGALDHIGFEARNLRAFVAKLGPWAVPPFLAGAGCDLCGCGLLSDYGIRFVWKSGVLRPKARSMYGTAHSKMSPLVNELSQSSLQAKVVARINYRLAAGAAA
jgi:hypothetical protein